MAPRPISDTSRPCVPSFRVSIGVSLSVEEGACRPDVQHARRRDRGLLARALVYVSAQRQAGALLFDRTEVSLAAEMAVAVEVPLGWRVHDEYDVLGAARELLAGLLLGEIEAPRPWRGGHSTAEPPEGNPVDLSSLAVKHDRRAPAPAGRAERLLRLVVAGNEDGWL